MAYTYLDVTNEILQDSNEVVLTAATFPSAVGVQAVAKNYINKAYLEICGKEVEWPFLVAANSNANEPYTGNLFFETVAGQRFYPIRPSSTSVAGDYARVDWDSFYLTSHQATGASAPYVHDNLHYWEYKEWADKYRETENQDVSGDQAYGQPERVFESIDGRFVGLSPIPDQVYRVYYSAWSRPTRLTAYDDTILIPDEYVPVLLNRANYYFLHWKKDHEEGDRVNVLYNNGLEQMRRALIGNQNDRMDDDRMYY